MITAAEILTRVRARTGQVARVREAPALGATEANDALLAGFITDALVRVAETGRLEGTIEAETEEDVADYVVPDGVREVLQVWLAGTRLAQTSGLAARAASTGADGMAGTATAWGVYGGRLWLNRVPEADGAELLIHVAYSDGYPVGDAEDILAHMPYEFRGPITDYVLAEWFALVGEGALASKHRLDFEEGLRRNAYDRDAPKITTRSYRSFY